MAESDYEYFKNLYNTEKKNKKPSELFTEWLYNNYSIGNGHRLTQLQEDIIVQLKFIEEYDLPEDVELFD